MELPSTWARVDAALCHALDLDGPARDAYVATLDAATRAAVEPLLRDALADDPVLDHPEAALASLAAPDVFGGERVGPYRIGALVGEGGMGRVYRAHRADGAFERTVALKVVRQSLALAGADVAARLRRERDLLAALDHPGIARLIGGGETDDGVPYLVTEFVDGAPITAWADARGLGVPDRARLLAEVARAVDHAHRRFVVHRDLKPSNVFVTERDGAPRPVVLDFGIAKLLDASGEESGTFPLTRTGMRLLTPAYAAPELYEPAAAVTTAADVYGLGALLYELLTGCRPHADTSTAGPSTSEPTRPSSRVARPGGGAAPEALARSRALRGDLDTICLKALHPDPARRYASAADLADDLDRHLAGRPVEARPDSVAYVVGRFARRHRSAVSGALVALVALVAALVVSLVSLQAEREALDQSRASEALADEAADLLAGVFADADPYVTDGREVTLREALDAAVGRVRTLASDELRGDLLCVFAHVHAQWGDYHGADTLYAEAVRALSGSGATPLALAKARYGLGRARGATGRYDDALRQFESASASAGDGPQAAAFRFRVLRDVSWIQREQGRHGEAVATAEAALEMAGALDEESRVLALYELASSLLAAGRTDEAEPVARETLARDEALYGPGHIETAHAMTLLGEVLVARKRLGQAEDVIRRGLRINERALGTSHPYTVESRLSLASVLLQRGRLREAQATVSAIDPSAVDGEGSAWQTARQLQAALDSARAVRG
ncbi:protein kinase domain-containing protein [Rubrivirga sp. IMCC45206]|uniref:serine/threonine-protein kinase n=1 Tax=Rubrivirga sp. IMCC45206 TaxID=3391614 RepID=UPI00398FE8EA